MRILLVDDDTNFSQATKSLLRGESHHVDIANSIEEANARISRDRFDLMLVDLALPDGSGLELVRQNGPRTVIITGHPSIETAVRAVRGPVVDYLVKPLDRSQLEKCIAAAQAGADRAPERRADSPASHPGMPIVGDSDCMVELRKKIADFGPTDVTILITGESGTGKELVAQALHRARNAAAPFVALNCGAIPQELIASELFGHEKGAFTGAGARRQGVFERAGEGTVFLDEIAELPLEQQVALLRVLESLTVRRVGGTSNVSIQARILAATNKNLESLVRKGEFREDLYYRLVVLPISVPPLRERRDDIPVLAHFFLQQFAAEYGSPTRLEADAVDDLCEYGWPGNVRELKHTLLRAAILNRGKSSIAKLPDGFRDVPDWSQADGLRPGMSISDVEKALIHKTLEHFGGRRKDTAEALGISPKTLYNRLREYDSASARD